MIESQIRLDEIVENKERKFGSALQYYPALIIDEDGRKVPALFTKKQIEKAAERAQGNPEDMPLDKRNLFQRLFGLLS